MSWYDRLDELKANIEALQAEGKFPACRIVVEPGPANLDALRRMRQRFPAVFLSLASHADDGQPFPTGTLAVTADIFHEGLKRPSVVERNRAAALIAEALHVMGTVRPGSYHGAAGLMAKPERMQSANLSYTSGADEEKCAWWRVTWDHSGVHSEEMSPEALNDFNLATIAANGENFGGEAHDTDDDESTEVELP